MTLKKGFLTPNINDLNISKKRFVIGLGLALLFSFSFYSLLFIAREGLRFLTVSEYYDLCVLNDDEVFFYNLFFAFLSTTLAQSILMVYLIQKPSLVFNARRFRKSDIFNDHTYLIWNLMSWFIKVATLYGYWMSIEGASIYNSFSFYSNYKYLFILIIILLLVSPWNSFLRIFKRKAYKWILLSITSISIVSFALASINILDYKALNEKFLSKNVFYNYQVDRVESNIYDRMEKRDLIVDLFLVYPKKSNENSKHIIVIHNQELELINLKSSLKQIYNNFDAADRKFIIVNMVIHKDLPMSFVNKVQFEMAGAGMYRILYDVIPKDISTANKIFFSRGFPKKQPSLESSGMNLEKYYSQCMSYGNINKIQPLSITHCLFNDSIVENNSLYSLFYNRIRCGSNSAFVLYNNEELNFESYFEVVSVFRQATIDLMEDYSFSIFAKHYNELENDQMKIVDEQIPARFFEFSPEALEYLRNKGLLNSK